MNLVFGGGGRPRIDVPCWLRLLNSAQPKCGVVLLPEAAPFAVCMPAKAATGTLMGEATGAETVKVAARARRRVGFHERNITIEQDVVNVV